MGSDRAYLKSREATQLLMQTGWRDVPQKTQLTEFIRAKWRLARAWCRSATGQMWIRR